MDTLDKKMLYELTKNSRISLIALAKILKISPERTRYRFEALKKDKIQHFIAIMNSASLGYSTYEMFIKFQNINQKIKDEIIVELSKSDKVAWIGDLEGNFDLGIIFLVENQLELFEVISLIEKKYSNYIMKKNISINLEGQFFSRDYIISKDRKEYKTQTYTRSKDIITIDDLDKSICKLIAKDSRITALDMAKVLKVSVDTIIKRLRNLEKKVISGYTITLDNKKINQQHYKLLIYLSNKSEEDKMISFLKLNNRVISIVKTLSSWDYEIDIEVDNIDQLKLLTMELTRIYSDMIRDYDILRVVDMRKYTFYP